MESSRNMSSKVISNCIIVNYEHIKARKKNPQNTMIASFSFTSMGKCNSMVELFTSAGRDIDSTIKFNANSDLLVVPKLLLT